VYPNAVTTTKSIRMVDILDLSPELLLCVASFLAQVDLLNVSATCWRLRTATESELYREYSNPFRRSLVPFIKRLLDRPDLAKYVRRLDLKAWDTLEVINPENVGFDILQLDKFLPSEPCEADYHLITDAAKSAGVIDVICPYGATSCVIDEIHRICIEEWDNDDAVWYEHLYDTVVNINDVPYDRKFCQLLRAGTEDSLVVLIVALLPNVSSIFLQGAPSDRNTLPWNAPQHNFHALRRLSGCAMDGELRWPAAWFNNVLEVGKLETFETSCTSSWWNANGIFGQHESQMSFSLQPRSLDLKHIVLHCCQLARTEIRDLLNACRHLVSFYYGTDIEDLYGLGPEKIYPAEIVRLLDPHKNSLVDLFLNIAIDDDYDRAHSGIKSLAHFSRLELLDTTADMWDRVQIDNVEGLDIGNQDRLCNRLPPNITFVNFGNESGMEVSIYQVRDLLYRTPEVLPNLQCLMVANVELDPELERELSSPDFRIDYRKGLRFDFQETNIAVSNGIYVKDTFISEALGDPAGMDLTKWTGSKYERSRPKSWRRPGTEYQDDMELTDFSLDDDSMSEDDRTEALRALGFLDVEDIVDEDDNEESEEAADS
jgi:hypothetical protein